MKTDLRNISKLAIVVLALTVAFSTSVMANGGDKENPNTTLKFIGNLQNQPVFELNLINSDDEYTVTFRDEAGNVLYNNKFRGGAGLTKKFLLKPEESKDVNLNVVIRSKKTNSAETYILNPSTLSLKKQ